MGAGSFFCVNSNGGIGNPIGRALRKGIALAKERNCEIMFFVDGLQNLDKIISCDKDNYIWLAELRKSLQTQLKGVRISLATKKNRPRPPRLDLSPGRIGLRLVFRIARLADARRALLPMPRDALPVRLRAGLGVTASACVRLPRCLKRVVCRPVGRRRAIHLVGLVELLRRHRGDRRPQVPPRLHRGPRLPRYVRCGGIARVRVLFR